MNAAMLLTVTEEAKQQGLGEYIVHELQDSNKWNILGYNLHLPIFKPISILGIEFDLSITLHVVMMWIAAIFLVTLFALVYRKKQLIPRGLANVLESITLFIRDEIAIPNLGPKQGKQLTPFLSTMFFFILTSGLMGIIPLFSVFTGNLSVTASLAIVTFIATQVFGMIENGVIGYWRNLVPHGVPKYLYPIMVPIEIIGLFTKPFALAMRLFANMIAGHAVIFALLGLIIALGSVLISPFSVGMAVFIYLLEILIVFIQAYIFTMLSALFIGMAVHPEH